MAGHRNPRCGSAAAFSSRPGEASLCRDPGAPFILAIALRRGDRSAALGATKTDQCTETKGRRNRLAAAMSAGNRAADEESQKPEQNTPSARSGQGAEGQERGPEARWKALS